MTCSRCLSTLRSGGPAFIVQPGRAAYCAPCHDVMERIWREQQQVVQAARQAVDAVRQPKPRNASYSNPPTSPRWHPKGGA